MQLSEAGSAMLMELEGDRGTMYHDQVGLPSIGVGHRLTVSELHSGKIHLGPVMLPWGEGLSPLAVEALLAHDTAGVAAALMVLVKVPLSQPQFDALVSWAFNVGLEAAEHSTLLKRLNRGEYAAVPHELRRWVYAKGERLPVLEARRETEIRRWEATV
jgi:lysozyme